MKEQACEPCAKRKVRCDRGEPCSNCKRRKQDHCAYPESSPFERIKKLENLVRRLGGDPDNENQRGGIPRPAAASSPEPRTQSQDNDREKSNDNAQRRGDPIVLEEDGQSFYLES
jgi:hypothetical protein